MWRQLCCHSNAVTPYLCGHSYLPSLPGQLGWSAGWLSDLGGLRWTSGDWLAWEGPGALISLPRAQHPLFGIML